MAKVISFDVMKARLVRALEEELKQSYAEERRILGKQRALYERLVRLGARNGAFWEPPK